LDSALGKAKPVIKVLAYTDDPTKVTETGEPFGIRELKQHVRNHQPAFATVDIKLVSRSSKFVHAINKLDHVLTAERFDEIWFFGIHQKNKSPFTLGIPGGGGPESELNQNEISLLDRLMRVDGGNPGIGILIAGDHANPPPDVKLKLGPNELCPPLNHETFLGLGRAIGKTVPRAGLLRKWQGPPTHCPNDSFNTQVFLLGTDPDASAPQMDPIPQHLNLQRFDQDGTPNPKGQPHQLFIYTDGQPIDIFPDHNHEGELLIPEPDPAIWPATPQVQPLPRVVAEGKDKRDGRPLKIVMAYDGDAVGFGRIAADSSWHHYFNVNLKFFRSPAPVGSDADRIGQYYGNLALWLAPHSLRRQMGQLMLAWIAEHPVMMEEAGSGAGNIGSAAFRTLLEVSSPCEINELLAAMFPIEIRNLFESINLPQCGMSAGFPSKELLLGTVLETYYYRVSSGFYKHGLPPLIDFDTIESGLKRAFTLLKARAKAARSKQNKLNTGEAVVPEHSDEPILERNTDMPRRAQSFFFTVTLARDPSNPLTFDLSLTPFNCKTVLGFESCKLRGELAAGAGQPLQVSGGRTLDDQSRGVLSLDIDFPGGRLKFAGAQTSVGEFNGAFVVVGRQGAVRRRADPNPEDGDTGTATGSQTLLKRTRKGKRTTKSKSR
jgi:hypothetical protein